jgi:hypothetical protein
MVMVTASAEAPAYRHGEVIENPIAAPNVSKRNEIAAAAMAPAIAGPHSR